MNTPSTLRQAIVLLSALPKPQLAAILKRLAPAQAAIIADQLTRLDAFDTAEFNRAVRQFITVAQQAERPAAKISAALRQTIEPKRSSYSPHPSSPDPQSLPGAANLLSLLDELPLERCLELLQGEEAHFLAAVLFLVSAKRCAEIVERMELSHRTRVLLELASIAEIPGATIDHIRRQLQRKLEFGGSIHARPEGMHRVRQMLEHLDPTLQGTIADSLAVTDPTLAAELHRNVFRFSDLLRLTRADVKKLLAQVDTALWAPALRHADERVRQHIFSTMAGAAVKILTQELAGLEELPVDQSIARQQQIVQIAQELFRKRIISRPVVADRHSRAA